MFKKLLLLLVLSAVVLAPWTYQPRCGLDRPTLDPRLRSEFRIQYVQGMQLLYGGISPSWSGFALGAFDRLFLLPWDNMGDLRAKLTSSSALQLAGDWMEEGLDRGPVFEWIQSTQQPGTVMGDREAYCAALPILASPDYARTGEPLEP